VLIARRGLLDELRARERGPREHACVPIRDGRPAREAGVLVEARHAMHERQHVDVGERVRLTREPRTRPECARHAIERLAQLCVRGLELRGRNAFARGRTPALGGLAIRDRGDRGRELRVGELREHRPHVLVEARHLDRGRGHVVDEARPHRDRGAALRIARAQRRLGEHVVEIHVDHARLAHDEAVVHEYRHDAVRVQLQELGRGLLEAPQVQHAALVVEALLGEREPHFLRAGRGPRVVEDEAAHRGAELTSDARSSRHGLSPGPQRYL
jgi:hypothetical protein